MDWAGAPPSSPPFAALTGYEKTIEEARKKQ